MHRLWLCLLVFFLLASCAVPTAPPVSAPEVPTEAAQVSESLPEPVPVPEPEPEPVPPLEPLPSPEEFVRVQDWLPNIETDLRYASEDNFTGCVIYDFTDAWLRYGTV